MDNIINNLSHFGDICAIPLFGMLITYFYNIEKKTRLEYVLLYFAVLGFISDILFTYIYLFSTQK